MTAFVWFVFTCIILWLLFVCNFAVITDLILWKLKISDLMILNSCVATSLSLSSWNVSWSALCLVSSLWNLSALVSAYSLKIGFLFSAPWTALVICRASPWLLYVLTVFTINTCLSSACLGFIEYIVLIFLFCFFTASNSLPSFVAYD